MSETEVRIRRAVAGDVDSLVDLMRGLARHLGDPIEHITRDALLRDGFGPQPEFGVFLAELEGAAVGYASFHDSYEPAYAARGVYLIDLFILSAARRQGIGRALLGAVAADAQARDRSFVWWTSQRANIDAQSAYEAMGATAEATVSHALTFEAFEKLASDAASRQD